MQIDSAVKYLTSPVKTPFFLFVGDNMYATAKRSLSDMGLDFVPMSGFCNNDDKMPDIDSLLTYIEEADINASGKKFVVTGLGELLALRGFDEATRALSRLKDRNVGGAKVILLLRGLVPLIAGLQVDPRFDDRRHHVVGSAECDISFTFAVPPVRLASALSGFKELLRELENGQYGSIVVNTAVEFDHSMFNISEIRSTYDGVRFYSKDFDLPPSCGNDDYWAQLLRDLYESADSLDEVYEKHGLNSNLDSDLYAQIAGNDYRSWLSFIYLKYNAATVRNGYLRFVLDMTSRFEAFAANVLNAIIDVPHTDKRFPSFYRERKVLVEKFPESDIAEFVINNRRVTSESIYKLTDGTIFEREEIIAWISKNGMIPQLDSIYPELAAYLKKYVFKCPELAELLTDYFDAYKWQKLTNVLEDAFLVKVDELAKPPRMFNRLPTRDEIIDSIDKSDAYLYWLDALGVEYLGLIEAMAQKRGLSIRIDIARAELPTITTINRGFFDGWQGGKNGDNGDKKLDDVKHKDAGGYDFTKNKLPIYLARELEIITSIIDRAATELAFRRCKRFIIASDHGASRLAVLRRKEEKYETETKTKHSGRCCRLFHPYDLPFAAEENGFLVLADYGRFKGGREADVEVHGGASLEEVVVPVIELSLKDGSITAKLVDDTVTVDTRTGTEITLFINSPVRDVVVVLGGKSYPAMQSDKNHYTVKLPDTKRAGEYPVDVYAGDNLIGKVIFKAHGKSGKVNNDFDDLF